MSASRTACALVGIDDFSTQQVVEDANGNSAFDHTSWADARVTVR